YRLLCRSAVRINVFEKDADAFGQPLRIPFDLHLIKISQREVGVCTGGDGRPGYDRQGLGSSDEPYAQADECSANQKDYYGHDVVKDDDEADQLDVLVVHRAADRCIPFDQLTDACRRKRCVVLDIDVGGGAQLLDAALHQVTADAVLTGPQIDEEARNAE